MTKPIRNSGPCFPSGLPRQRGQRDVLSHTEFINVHILHALIFQTIPLELPRKPPTANCWAPALRTPRGDKYYNQYRPQCEVCPRDHCKMVESLQGVVICHTINWQLVYTSIHVHLYTNATYPSIIPIAKFGTQH